MNTSITLHWFVSSRHSPRRYPRSSPLHNRILRRFPRCSSMNTSIPLYWFVLLRRSPHRYPRSLPLRYNRILRVGLKRVHEFENEGRRHSFCRTWRRSHVRASRQIYVLLSTGNTVSNYFLQFRSGITNTKETLVRALWATWPWSKALREANIRTRSFPSRSRNRSRSSKHYYRKRGSTVVTGLVLQESVKYGEKYRKEEKNREVTEHSKERQSKDRSTENRDNGTRMSGESNFAWLTLALTDAIRGVRKR